MISSIDYVARELDRLWQADRELTRELESQGKRTDDIDQRLRRIESLKAMGASASWYIIMAILLSANLPEPLRSWVLKLAGL